MKPLTREDRECIEKFGYFKRVIKRLTKKEKHEEKEIASIEKPEKE